MISSELESEYEAAEPKRGGWNQHQEHGNYPDYWCFEASLTPNPSLYLSLSLFLSFAEICHIARGPSARQGATMYNPTENKSPRSNTAQLLKQASEPRRHGAALRPSETLWTLWFSDPPQPTPTHPRKPCCPPLQRQPASPNLQFV